MKYPRIKRECLNVLYLSRTENMIDQVIRYNGE